MAEDGPSNEDLVKFLEGKWNLGTAVLDLEEPEPNNVKEDEEE